MVCKMVYRSITDELGPTDEWPPRSKGTKTFSLSEKSESIDPFFARSGAFELVLTAFDIRDPSSGCIHEASVTHSLW